MKNQLLLLVAMLLPLVASAHDIAVQNSDGVSYIQHQCVCFEVWL